MATDVIARLLAACLLGVLAAAARAQQLFPCSLASKAAATVLHEGAIKATPLGLDNCDGVRVVTGEVVVTWLTSTGRRRSATYGAGKDIVSAAFFGGEAPKGAGAWLSVLDFLHGAGQAQTLGTRGGTVAVGPEGACLGLGKALVIDAGGADLLELRAGDASRPVARAWRRPAGAVALDLADLRRGASYTWTLQRDGKTAVTGTFHVLPAKDVTHVRVLLKRIDDDPNLDANGRVLVKADWLRQNSYTCDAREVLREGGFEVSGATVAK